MEDLFIVGGVVFGLWLLKRHLDAQAASGAIATAAGVSTAATTSGGYQVASAATMLGVTGYGAASSYSPGTVPAPAPVPTPPPPYYGGTVGGVGSGGNPLGGSLRAGVSAGTIAGGGSFTVNPDGSVGYRAPTAGTLNPGTLAIRSALPVGHR